MLKIKVMDELLSNKIATVEKMEATLQEIWMVMEKLI